MNLYLQQNKFYTFSKLCHIIVLLNMLRVHVYCSKQRNKISNLQPYQQKINNKEGSKNKNSQGRVTDKKQYIAMTNMTAYTFSEKQQSTSDYPSNLDQIEAIGAPIITL